MRWELHITRQTTTLESTGENDEFAQYFCFALNSSIGSSQKYCVVCRDVMRKQIFAFLELFMAQL